MTEDKSCVEGVVVAELTGPDGRVKARCVTSNLITAVGDQYYAGRAALGSGLPAQVTGMKLGTGSTTPAKTGGGAALATYLADSHQAIADGYPTATGGAAQFQAVWAPGKATTESPITEAVLVTDTLANATSPAASTIARVLLTGIGLKQPQDSLTLTWTHTILGS